MALLRTRGYEPMVSECLLESETGALSLYLRVGMTVRHSSTVHRKSLRRP